MAAQRHRKDNRRKLSAVPAPLRWVPVPEERLSMPEPGLSGLALARNQERPGRAEAPLPAVCLEQLKGFGTLDRKSSSPRNPHPRECVADN